MLGKILIGSQLVGILFYGISAFFYLFEKPIKRSTYWDVLVIFGFLGISIYLFTSTAYSNYITNKFYKYKNSVQSYGNNFTFMRTQRNIYFYLTLFSFIIYCFTLIFFIWRMPKFESVEWYSLITINSLAILAHFIFNLWYAEKNKLKNYYLNRYTNQRSYIIFDPKNIY
jgi:hypothetical protein